MDVNFAFLCDYADVSGGKVNALGIGFDTIYAPSVPAQHGLFHVVVEFRGSIAEVGEKDFALRIIDADGRDIIPPLNRRFSLDVPAGAIEGKARLRFSLEHVPFPQYGQYSVHLTSQGHEMVRLPIRVASPPETGT